jgi:septum site-determining protein MinC
MAQYITINLKKDVIVMKLSEKATQADTIKSLKKKLPELKKLYQQEKTPIFVTGRILKNKELKEIEDLIKKSINVEIEFDTPKALGLNEIRRTYNKDVEISEAKIHRGSLRSGQRIEYEGTLIVLGDVNAGAEVIAGDNVVVVGNLRGLAHAGAKGNKQAIVAAHRIDTHQLRIANIIKELEKDDDAYNVAYTYAYAHENGREIVLE